MEQKMRSGKFSLAALIAAGVVGVSTVSAAPFTAGDLARLPAAASASNTTGSVVEVNSTTAAQSPTNIIPIDGATTPNELRFSGSATSTGYLSHSDDRSLLTFTGANSAATTGNTNTFNPRGVGVLDPSGTFSLPTTYTGTSGNQTRSATTLNDSTWFRRRSGAASIPTARHLPAPAATFAAPRHSAEPSTSARHPIR